MSSKQCDKTIEVYWTKEEFWDELSYEDKLRYYWEFKVVDGIRVYDREVKSK